MTALAIIGGIFLAGIVILIICLNGMMRDDDPFNIFGDDK